MKNKEKLVGTLSDDSDDNAVKVEDTKLVIKKKFLSDKKRKRPSSDEYENPGFYAALDQGIEIRNELKFFLIRFIFWTVTIVLQKQFLHLSKNA